MVSLILVIHTEPPMAFYRGDRPAYDLAWPALVDIGTIRSGLRTSGGETPNTSAKLDNGRGHLTSLFSDAPLLSEVSIHREGVEIWRGVLAAVEIRLSIDLDLEA